MLNLDAAIESRKFYTLEMPVRALQPPVRTLRLFYKAGCAFVWQVATARREQLLHARLTEAEIDAVEAELKAMGLKRGMRIGRELRVALAVGRFPKTRSPEYLDGAVPLLMEYVLTSSVSDRTRELVEMQRDSARKEIEEYRGRYHTMVYETRVDRHGLKEFISCGIVM